MAERKENDSYFTPSELATAIVDRVASTHFTSFDPSVIWEPHCGGGAFLKAARAKWPDATIIAFDLMDRFETAMLSGADEFYRFDFLCELPDALKKSAGFRLPDLIIGNPPYDFAENHTRKALSHLDAGGVVAFLLRLAFGASGDRTREGGISRSGAGGMGLVDSAPVVPRPSFTDDGASDNSEYSLFQWVEGSQNPTVTQPRITWEKPKVPRRKPTKEEKIQECNDALADLTAKYLKLEAKRAVWAARLKVLQAKIEPDPERILGVSE